MKRLFLTTLSLFCITSNSFGGACYTAVNGFLGAYNVAEQMAEQTENTSKKLAELNLVMQERDSKIKELSAIEVSIMMINKLKFEKNKSIINSLKAKNELRDNSILIEQIEKDLEK